MADVSAYLSLPYTKVLTRDEDGVVIAEVRELPGCIAHGDSETEAIALLNEAQASWIEGVLEQGKQPPLPAAELPSGKWLQRVPRTLHRKLVELAGTEETSLNQLVTAILAEAVAARAPRVVEARTHGGWDAAAIPPNFKWKVPPDVSSRFTDHMRQAAGRLSEAVEADSHLQVSAGGKK